MNRHNCKSVISANRQQGFTLLEMMLTVFLIGISVSLVAVRIGQDTDDIARLEARRFAALVSHLQDESTIIGLPMGVEVSLNENRYRFWQLSDNWAQVERQQVLREREVPADITLTFALLQDKKPLQTEEQSEDDSDDDADTEKTVNKAPRDLLVVEPSGLVQPFIAGFSGENKEFRVVLDNQLNPVVSERER